MHTNVRITLDAFQIETLERKRENEEEEEEENFAKEEALA